MERREIPPNPERENRKPLRIAVCSTPWLEVPPKSYGGIEALVYDALLNYPAEKLDFFLYSVGETAHRRTAKRLKGKIGYHFDHELYKEIQKPGASVKEAIHLVNFYKEIDERIKNGEHFDLIHHHLMFIGGFAAFFGSKDIPHLITMHGPIEDPMDIEFLRSIGTEPGIYFNSISDNQRRNLPDLPWIGTVHNGVNCERFNYSPVHRNYLLNIGRINKAKGQETAIEVAEKCKKTLILAGNVENQAYFDREIAPRVQVRIDKLGSGFTKLEALEMILNNAKRPEIIYFGEADFEEKVKLYQYAHAFINPIAWEEPYGLVMPEAMICGTPVISFARGAAPEIIVDGQTGFLIPYQVTDGEVDIRGLVEAVGKIDKIHRPDCKEHILENFSAGAVARRYREVYDLILEKERERKGSGI
jgi:glycosyltransferase involved in cell wall biosynthesis